MVVCLLDTTAENMTESLITEGLVELKRSGLKQNELVVLHLVFILIVKYCENKNVILTSL